MCLLIFLSQINRLKNIVIVTTTLDVKGEDVIVPSYLK